MAAEEKQTAEQAACAAKGHQPWMFATKTVTVDAWGVEKKRVRYCTGCGMDAPTRRVPSTDTPQQKRALRSNRNARWVRKTYPAGTRVWSVGGTPPRRCQSGTVVRHVPQLNAQGGYLVVAWDNGRTGNIGAISLERA